MTAISEVFWGEIVPCEHLVQIYEESGVFLDSLEGFVAGGLRAGDGVLVIAVPANIESLDERLSGRGFDVDEARANDQYITLDASETLAKFMVNGAPDDERFEQLVTQLLARAGRDGRQVRAFGEMVAVLWANGYMDATMHLEKLWHKLCQQRAFSLFCAYPRSGFAKSPDESIEEICKTHSLVIGPRPGERAI